ELHHAGIREGVADRGMPILFVLAALVHGYQAFSAFIGEPYLLARDGEVGIGLERTAIDGAEHSHVHDGNAEALHEVEGQRIRSAAGLVENAKAGLEANSKERADDISIEQAIPEREQGVESVARRA